ncbi:(d)CMP kinase [Nakamurella sp.]|uniref:(d)CMP kinase n=1 Tax=Nakamurella sp. TaxID=1869182 RepID=UPI003B3B8E20
MIEASGPDRSRSFVIAIDGPAGTGKSTVARRVAQALDAGYLDTGAMYRIVTLAVLRSSVEPTDEAAVAGLLPGLVFDSPTNAGRQRHSLDGVDVGTEIRGPAVTLAVTPVSANPAVRGWLLDRQRRLARSGRMVVEGRDIGTVVVPDADLKIYRTADADERARRRQRQSAALVGGSGPDLAAVATDLQRRDSKDASRTHAPLQAAADAIVVDSSSLAIEETVAHVLGLAAERGITP